MPKYSDRPCARCGKMMLHAYCSQRYCKACAPLVRSDDAIISRAKQRSKRAMSEIARVERAARAAMIHNFIVRLPKGYDTMIGDSGANISKGQKQLMTIARAMLLDSKMLILDEATSNVDTRTEQKIQAAMRQLMEGRTSFVIAHRLSTIRNADHILVVDDGNIAEQGTHEQLMAQNGPYSKLYYAQFETY